MTTEEIIRTPEQKKAHEDYLNSLKREEIEKAVRTCIAIEWDNGRAGFDGNRLTQKILEIEDILDVVIKTQGIRVDNTDTVEMIGCYLMPSFEPLIEDGHNDH